MTRNPAISVIVPTHNRPDYLAIALRSLALQTFRNFEVIVVNDAGEDVSSLVRSFEKNLDIRLITHSRNKGLSAARNTGIATSSGKYIAYLDDDDIYYEQHLSQLYAAAQKTGAKVVYSSAVLATQRPWEGEYVTVSRTLYKQQAFDRNALLQFNITPVLNVMHERACLEHTGGFTEYLFAHEDWDLWVRLSRHFDFHHINLLTCEFTKRTDASSMSTSANKKNMRESWIFVYCQGLFYKLMPTVQQLQANVAQAVRLDTDEKKNILPHISIIVPIAKVSLATTLFFINLCANLGVLAAEVELVIVGSGVDAASLQSLGASLKGMVKHPPVLLHIPSDAGRVLSANAGAAQASGEWLVFLEDEVEPISGWLASLLETATNSPHAGAIGCILEIPHGRYIMGGTFSPSDGAIFSFGSAESTEKSRPTDLVSSHCFMIRSRYFSGLGGFSSAFAPGHYADADLCLRLRKEGLLNYIALSARCAWNKENNLLLQSATGIPGRRTLLDRYGKKQRAVEPDIAGADWSKRVHLWPSDTPMPTNFEIEIPESLAE